MLMPPLIQKWNQLKDEDKDLFPLLEVSFLQAPVCCASHQWLHSDLGCWRCTDRPLTVPDLCLLRLVSVVCGHGSPEWLPALL